ncbi:MAG: C25 family cysteine peptidase [Bacteroidota bacterium]
MIKCKSFITIYFLLINSLIVVAQNLSTDNSWIRKDRQYLKLGVAADGIYRVEYSDLTSYGINPLLIDPQKFVLYKSGIKVPIYVGGNEDGRFDENDYIEFVGIRNMGGAHRKINNYDEPYNEYLGRYTDTTVYWLTWNDTSGSAINLTNPLPAVTPIASLNYYHQVIHLERNIALDYSIADLVRKELPFWTENKTWIESLLNVGTKTYQLSVANIYPDKPAYIFARMQDYASDIQSNNHVVSIGINNSTMYDTTVVNRYEQALLSAEINSNLLVEGTNNLKVQSSANNASINVLAMDWVELEYPKHIKAENDSLLFSFPYLNEPGIYEVKVEDINSGSLVLWKFNGTAEKYLAQNENNSVRLIDTVSADDKFLICREDQVQKPKIYYSKIFTSLQSNQDSYDYILITHKKFKNSAEEYGRFISDTYNKKVKVLDVDDIYDEFSYGFFNPEAIQNFLKSAYENWSEPKPEFVFLVGGATYDYHGNKNKYTGSPKVYNYVPSFGVPVSDNWFVMWDEQNPMRVFMSIGRLPVKTVEEFNWYFIKHKELVQNRYDAWNKRFLFFSGGTGNNQNQIDALRNVNQKIIDSLIVPDPIGGVFTHFYKTLNPVSNFGPYTQEQIQSAIDSGGVFISYIGHSGTQTWDNSITDVNQLKNSISRYPLITDFGCSTARFAEPDVTSFSQLFVNSSDGQAIGYIGNTSLGFTSTSYSFPEIFFRKIIRDSVLSIGKAHRLAKEELISKYGTSPVHQLFILTNTLIGDPIINLPLPAKTNLFLSETGVKYFQESFSDSEDSVKIKLIYFNYGSMNNGKFNVTIKKNYLGTDETVTLSNIDVPHFKDSLVFSIPVKEKPGRHTISISLDSSNLIDEIYEDDNTISFEFNVASSTIKVLTSYKDEAELKNPVLLLSPTNNPGTNSMIVETADNNSFDNYESLFYKIDTAFTQINLSSKYRDKRVWLRTKLENSNEYSQTTSFVLGDTNKYLMRDSLTFAKSDLTNLTVIRDSLFAKKDTLHLSVLSAGFHDGNTALIQVNAQNYIPENTLRGHHVVVFEESNLKFVSYRRFDTYTGGDVHNQYLQFLDTLSSKYIIAVAVSDEGRITNSALRSKLKEYGSVYIDQLVFRGSWAFIGKKGAAPGMYDEAVSNPFNGRVHANHSISKENQDVKLITTTIGPAVRWKSVNISIDENSSFKIIPLGIKNDNKIDTLTSHFSSSFDISGIDADKYPRLKLLVVGDNISVEQPFLNSIRVDYDQPPELILNYQTAAVEKDTLEQGEEISLSLMFVNAGYSTAKDVKLSVDLITPQTKYEEIFTVMVDSIQPGGVKKLSWQYKTNNVTGDIKLGINIDPANSITEFFEDNNFFEIPVFVKKDDKQPVLRVKIDDIDIIDGDYISSDPNIKIELSDESILPIVDTTAVDIFLNDTRLDYLSNAHLNYNFSPVNPKFVINYNPHLDDGNYKLKVTASNVYNSEIEKDEYSKTFIVSSKTELLHVYNYPNPFADETYFTFKLTQIPDELRIKVFTLAGRMIKEITKNSHELNYDFNRIHWDGRDEDGDLIANGVYLYKVILKKGNETVTTTQKLAVVR